MPVLLGVCWKVASKTRKADATERVPPHGRRATLRRGRHRQPEKAPTLAKVRRLYTAQLYLESLTVAAAWKAIATCSQQKRVDQEMQPEDIAKVVEDLVGRVIRRLEDATHGELPTAADERLFAEQFVRLKQAITHGACRLFPQALTLDRCSDIASMIEQTLLRPDARENEIREICRDAVERGYAAICIGLEWVEVAAATVKGATVQVCVPVGFPSGGQSAESKAAEVRRAVALGADEVDVVIALDRLRAGDYRAVAEDLQGAFRAAQGRTVKAVIEAAELTCEQKTAAAVLAKSAGARFVKSSTGFGPDGVTVGDVALIRSALTGKAPPSKSALPEFSSRVGAVVCLDVSTVSV